MSTAKHLIEDALHALAQGHKLPIVLILAEMTARGYDIGRLCRIAHKQFRIPWEVSEATIEEISRPFHIH